MFMEGRKIKKIRQSLGLTQEEFAHRLGVTLCTVNRWENNKSVPSRLAVMQLERYAEAVH
ncbi:helix-turn-helix domain-containing protein [bacterium]|nr:helix-turn-helix domain-containing protein [bacterium]